jgi:hypothetical protein
MSQSTGSVTVSGLPATVSKGPSGGFPRATSVWAATLVAFLTGSAGCASHFTSHGVQSPPTQCGDDLVAERERAASRGLDWLEAFLDDDRHLADVGSDAVEIFLEAGVSASSAIVRQRCLATAKRYAGSLLPRYLESGALQDHRNLTSAWTLVVRAEELNLDVDQLIAKLSARMQSITTFAEEYNVTASDVGTVADGDLTMLVVHAYLVERLRTVHPEIKSIPRLRQVLARLKDPAFWRRAAEDDDFREDFGFIATHVYYALNDYGRLSVRPTDVPAAWEYMQRELSEALAEDQMELVAEFIDIFHGAGLSESNDQGLCEATRMLLAAQNADGSWGTREPFDDSYDTIHPTWTAVHALRTRIFLSGTAFDRRRDIIIDENMHAER